MRHLPGVRADDPLAEVNGSAARSAIELAAHDGHKLAGRRFDASESARASVVIAPAMAVPQGFYAEFAAWLASRDYTPWTFDYRGTGASLKGSMRHNQPAIRRKAPLMWHVLAPALCPLFGYFPGERLGVIGDLPTSAMMQRRRWRLTPDYILSGDGRADYHVIDPASIGHKRVGHFGFFKPNSRERLWPMVGDWLDAQLAQGKHSQ